MEQRELGESERRALFEDGFVIVREAVPRALIERARARVSAALPKSERRLLVPASLATHPDIVGLFSTSPVAGILRRTMGPFPDVISCQVAVTPPFDHLGGTPHAHVDGSWSGEIPADAADIEMPQGRPRDPARYFGERDDKRGSNDGQLWIDPDRTLSIGSYTALVGIALNDQLEPGNGQLGVLKGRHEDVEAAFRAQRDAGGPIGPEGPGWPRIQVTPDGQTFMNGLHDTVRRNAARAAALVAATDQWPWPELTPVLLRAGDAVIALHSCPHTPTPNLGPNPRMSIYFRIRRLREGNPHEGSRRVGHGVSDHPDRGYFGQFLDYPDGYDPWQTSIAALCDHWQEWDGMQDLVVASRRTNA